MATRIPLVVFWHFFGGAKQTFDNRSMSDFLHASGRTLLAGAIAIGMQLVVAVGIVLWLVPFGPWRQAVIGAVRALTLTLGQLRAA